jgi:hypothetical protein
MTFQLEIGQDAFDGYPVTARSPQGNLATGRFELSGPMPTIAALRDLLGRLTHALISSSAGLRRQTSPEEQVVQSMGAAMFDALPEPVRELLTASLDKAETSGDALRVMLLVHPPELAHLPWEFLYDPGQDDYLFLGHHLVRHLPVRRAQRPLRVRPPLRVLAMVGRADRLAPQDERERLSQAMADLVASGDVEVGWVRGHRWRDLKDALRGGNDWHILHVIGHGDFDPELGEGTILFEDDHGQPYPMPASNLATLLRGRPSIRLVVLNACDTGRASAQDPFSSLAGALVRRRIPAVVAMQFPVTDRAAIEFSRSFYGALASGRRVEEGVTEARQDIRYALPGSLEWGTPVLYGHASGDPVFDISRARSVLWRPTRIRTITAQRDVNAVAFSPDGGLLALACDGRGPWLLESDGWTGQPPRRTFGASLYGVAFDPDGMWLATAGLDDVVRIWDSDTGELVLLIPHADWVSDVAFSPDGELATACGDRVARVWQLSPGGHGPRAELRRELPHGAAVRAVAFDPGGERLATACDDRIARIWDTAAGGPAAALAHPGRVFGVAFSSDGDLLATACRDGHARIWRADEREQLRELAHDGPVLDVAFSPDGRLLATASRDGKARAWEVNTGKTWLTVHHRGPVRRLAFSPDGRWLATASFDNTCQVWQFATEHTGPGPDQVEVLVDAALPSGAENELLVALAALGLSPGAPVRESPSLRSAEWLVVLTLPLGAFITAISAKLGQDVYDRLARAIRNLMAGRQSGEVIVIDPESGARVHLTADLPKGAIGKLIELDPSTVSGDVRYDRREGRWRADDS